MGKAVPTSQILRPEDFKGDMANLSAFVQREITAAENARRPLEQRWAVSEQIYRMEPDSAGTEIIEGLQVQPDSIGREVCQRIATATRTALFSPSPIMQALPDGDTLVESEELEKGMQTLIERMKLDEAFKRSLLQTTLSNAAILRVRPTSKGEIVSERIHPQDFIVGPNYDIDLKDAHLTGHRTYMAGWRISEAMNNPDPAQKWRECDFTSSSPESTDKVNSSSTLVNSMPNQFGESESYQLTQVFECIMRLPVERDKKVTMEMWLLVHLPDSQQTVFARPYTLSRPWYFDIRFEREEGRWWPKTSVMSTIQGYCNDMTDLKSCIVQGAQYKAFPPVVVSGGGFKDKDQFIKPGHMYLFDQDVQSTTIDSGVDIADCLTARQELRQNVFGMTGISQMGTGQELKSGATATEAGQLAAVQQQSENVYAQQAAFTLEEISLMIQEYCQLYPATINSFYKDALTEAFWDSVDTPVRWASSGKSADNSPSALLAKFDRLFLLAQDPEFGMVKHELASALISALQLPIEKEKLQYSEDQVKTMLEMYRAQVQEQQMASSAPPQLGGASAPVAATDMPMMAA